MSGRCRARVARQPIEQLAPRGPALGRGQRVEQQLVALHRHERQQPVQARHVDRLVSEERSHGGRGHQPGLDCVADLVARLRVATSAARARRRPVRAAMALSTARSTAGPSAPTSRLIWTTRNGSGAPAGPPGPSAASAAPEVVARCCSTRPYCSGFGILELPAGEQPCCTCSRSAASASGRTVLGAQLGVRGELREHPDQAVGDRLAAGVPRRLDDLDHGVNRHAVRGVEDERAALPDVAAHLHQPAQRLGPQRRNQRGRAPAQRAGFLRGGRLQLAGDLQQVPDDHLIVGFGASMFVDRLGDGRRFRGHALRASRRRWRSRPWPGRPTAPRFWSPPGSRLPSPSARRPRSPADRRSAGEA